MFPWSDDCLNCLCNLPHSLEEHNQAVEQARAELQQERAEVRSCIEDDCEEADGINTDQQEALKSIANAMLISLLREGI